MAAIAALHIVSANWMALGNLSLHFYFYFLLIVRFWFAVLLIWHLNGMVRAQVTQNINLLLVERAAERNAFTMKVSSKYFQCIIIVFYYRYCSFSSFFSILIRFKLCMCLCRWIINLNSSALGLKSREAKRFRDLEYINW